MFARRKQTSKHNETMSSILAQFGISLSTLSITPSAEAYYRVIEALFFLLIIYLALTRAYLPWKVREAIPANTAASKLASWRPAPLATPLPPSVRAQQPLDINILSVDGANITLDASHLSTDSPTTTALNFATNDFLGLHAKRSIREAARIAMRDYGCGACGPRGFYGTTDLHLQCEHRVATFCDSSSAILYSFGAATANSTIPAFCKRGDIVVVDDSINFVLYSGVRLSRANMLTFEHNNMNSLEAVLKSVCEKHVDKAAVQRRFIVVEAIYANSGDLSPLDEIARLKDQYRFRLLLDESYSIGVLGHSGRGALQHFDVPRKRVEIATADLGNAIASVGGICVGNAEVVEHQRLSGAGYCFSASQPPFLAAAATAAMDVVENEGESLISRLRSRVKLFRDMVDVGQLKKAGWYLDGHPVSPMIFARRYDDNANPRIFTDLQERCLEDGILVARPVYSTDELKLPKHAVKITISAVHSDEMIRKAAQVLMHNLLDVGA